jgi:hypothetical protein
MSLIKADREQTNLAFDTLIKRDAGITGLTVVGRILNGDDLDESLDFNDGVFKTAGHTTPTVACPAIDATNDPGLYGLVNGFDLSAITIPAGVNTMRLHFTITAGGEVGDSYDVVELDDRLVDLMWDEVNRGADHNIKDSTGKQQRQASGGADSEDVVSATATTVRLAATESAIDGFLNFREIVILAGTGVGQLRVIESYVGATQTATLDRAWDTTPVAGDDYLLLLSKRTFPDRQEVRDSLKLAPSGGAPAVDSVDAHLDDILVDTGTDIPARFTGIEGATFATGTDSLEAIRNQGDAAWLTATGFSTHSAADVDTVLSGTHGGGSWLSATGFSTPADVTAVITQGNIAWLTATGFAVAGDAMTLTAAGVDSIWDELQAGHVTPGSFGVYLDAPISGIAGITPQAVRDAMKLAPTGGAPAVDSIDTHLDDILVDTGTDIPARFTGVEGAGFATGTDSLEAIRNQGDSAWLTATGFATPANVTAVITQGDIAWTTATGFAVAGDAMALTPAERTTLAGVIDALLVVANPKPWTTGAGASPAVVAAAVWAEALPGAFGAGSAGLILGTNLDVVLSTRSSHTAANVDTVLSGSHGGGSWLSATGFAVAGDAMTLTAGGVDLIWDELQAGHVGAGSFGLFLDAPVSTAGSPAAIATAVWSEALPGAFGGGTAGLIVGTNLDALVSSRSSHTAAGVDTVLSGTHGGGSWLSATGFAVAGDAMTLTAGALTAVATEVWSTDISGNSSKLTEAGGMLNILRKGQTNDYTLTPGALNGTFVLLDDDDTTPILSQLINDAVGGGIASPLLSPARRAISTI